MTVYTANTVEGQQYYPIPNYIIPPFEFRPFSIRVSGRFCKWKLVEKRRWFLWKEPEHFIKFAEPSDKSGRRIRIEVL